METTDTARQEAAHWVTRLRAQGSTAVCRRSWQVQPLSLTWQQRGNASPCVQTSWYFRTC